MATNDNIVYEPHESPPLMVTFVVGLQGAVVMLTICAAVVSVTLGGAGLDGEYLAWAIFAAFIVNGAATALQGTTLWRFGAGHIVFVNSAAGYLPANKIALAQGGPALLASLVIVSSLLHFLLAAWLPLLRRIVTPVVSGSILMLLAVITIPLAFDRVLNVPQGVHSGVGLLVAGVVLVITVSLGLLTTGRWRMWVSVLGLLAGCGVSAVFGIYDTARVVGAPWVGVPAGGWPGIDLTPGVEFWAVLPLFLVLTLVNVLRAVAGGIVVQRASRRRERVTDFRRIQGTVNAAGVGSFMAGVGGTLPPATMEANSVTLLSLTGVASRHVGFAIGAVLIALAFIPKVSALLLAISGPVMGMYMTIVFALLLMEGARTVLQEGLDYRRTLIAAVSLGLGICFYNTAPFTGIVGEPWNILLNNGLMAGTAAAVLMTALMNLTTPRSLRLETELNISALPALDRFLQDVARRAGWNQESTERVRIVGEEALSSLLTDDGTRLLTVMARPTAGTLEMEFLSSLDDENLEDRLAFMGDQTETLEEHEISFRLLRHYASQVRHRKYYGLDIVTVRVDGLGR